MADVQLENGYCKIANEIIEALARTRIPGQAGQVLLAIVRRTYGWNKKEATISNRDLMDATGMSHVHVYRAVQKLVEMNLIVRTELGTKKVKYQFNKDFDKWIFVPKKVQTRTQKDTKSSHNGTNSSGRDNGDKDLPDPKDIIKDKKDKKTYVEGGEELALVDYFISLLDKRNYPWKNNGKPDRQKWADGFDKILRIDGRAIEEIKAVLSWCQRDDFWQDNILSPVKLRKQYEQLVLKARKAGAIKKSDNWLKCPVCQDYYREGEGCPRCQ